MQIEEEQQQQHNNNNIFIWPKQYLKTFIEKYKSPPLLYSFEQTIHIYMHNTFCFSFCFIALERKGRSIHKHTQRERPKGAMTDVIVSINNSMDEDHKEIL